ncbi:MAG: ABC transporter permease [Planctomycetia bacterium]
MSPQPAPARPGCGAQSLGVLRKELRATLVSPIPYILVALFALALSYVFFYGLDERRNPSFWLLSTASVNTLFGVIPVAFAVLVPALTMRMWSEEMRAGTLETLRTMPVSAGALVLGKFLACWVLLAACLLATLPIVLTVDGLGDLDWGPVWGGYLGAMFLGGALVALGLWISGLTRHQVVAFLVTLFAGLVLCQLLTSMASDANSGLGPVFHAIALDARYDALGRGVLEVRDLAYFASFTAFFLYLNAESIDSRRYA